MPDQFFTPTPIARKLISFFRTSDIQSVVDFAAGDGELLRAATERWPDVKCFATDIDKNCVSRLRRLHPDWSVGKCDFLSERSRSRSSILKAVQSGVSLVLLNPPFSCRGNSYIEVAKDQQAFRCSTAMAFVMHSLDYLVDDGRLVTVLPASSIKSRKDSHAWDHIRSRFDVRIVASFGLRTFPDCAASTVIVRLQRLKSMAITTSRNRSPSAKTNLKLSVVLVRGCVPMHSARNGWAGTKYDLVHTTDMNQKNVTQVSHQLNIKKRATSGPCVLIPRVGQPSKSKCVLYLGRRQMVLSDCVYAIRCSDSDDARKLQRTLLKNWDIVSNQYGGTCAPYLTLADLAEMLRRLGVTVEKIEATGHL